MRFSIFNNVKGFHHALSTRRGGVSQGEFDSLNLAFHVGDDAESVRENRLRWAREAGFCLQNLATAQQVHGSNVQVVTREASGRGALSWDGAVPDCDALVTSEHELPLLILVADCAPLLLVDPIQRVCAVVHAGWRGALAGIAGKTIEVMRNEFGAHARDVLVVVGPCLSAHNLEVGEEVAFLVEAKDARAVVRRDEWLKPHLDLRGLIARDLETVGVNAPHIEISPICPKERNDLFFSHRGQSGRAGRFGIVAWWE